MARPEFSEVAAGATAGTDLPAQQCLRSCHLFDHVSDAVLVVELPSTRISLWNAAAARVFGYSEAEAAGLRLVDLILERHRENFRAALAAKDPRPPVELVAVRRDGREITIEAVFGLLEGRGAARTSELVIMRDISSRKRAEAALAERALHDQLTGLPNRWLLADRFRQRLLAARRGGSTFAVLVLDLDGFKQINDRLGHLAGDEVLGEVARRLCKAVRASDTVARVGGDEFVVLLTAAEREEDAQIIARRILKGLAAPMLITGQVLRIHASIGLAMFPDDGRDIDALTNAADQAMLSAKRAGGGLPDHGACHLRPAPNAVLSYTPALTP